MGEMIDRDMQVVAASGEQRLVVLGAPAYLARHPAPEHPRDLAAHNCILWQAGPGAVPYRWELPDPEDGHDFTVALEGQVATNDFALMARPARAGVGLTMLMEEVVRAHIERGHSSWCSRRIPPRSPGSIATTRSAAKHRRRSARSSTTYAEYGSRSSRVDAGSTPCGCPW
jgi:DNA-binding transcriptional LysR family regulator